MGEIFMVRSKNVIGEKLIAIFIVLGLPALGLVLLNVSQTMGEDMYYFLGIFLIFLFPLVIAINLLRYKSKTKVR
jgi:hypothetical protein